MKLSSINQKNEICLELKMCGYADDEDWFKEVRVSVEMKGQHNNVQADFLAYLHDGKDDEVTDFVKGLHELFESRQGKVELHLEGMEQQDCDRRSITLSFYAIDSSGHIGLALSVSGATRYSNTAEFPFCTTTSFEIDPSLVEEVAYTIEALYEGVGRNA